MSPPRVLLVDDDRDTLDMLALMLTGSGFEVASATTVAEALALLPNGFTAVCTDLSMPGCDGFDFIRTIRTHESASIPIVVVSGQARDLAERRAYDLGCCVFLQKPVDPKVIVSTLHSLIHTCGTDCSDCVWT